MIFHLPRDHSGPLPSHLLLFASPPTYLSSASLRPPHLLISLLALNPSIMGESSASYIRMVQHLIEKCLLFHMNKEECVEALDKHANILPVITSTVWTELVKENREFFESYARNREERALETETMQRMLRETAARDPDDDDDDDDDD